MSDPEPHPIHRGPLLIVSGPSGTGKSTLVKRMLKLNRWPLRLSVSATTRSPRPGETQGTDYFFWTNEQFEAALAAGEFLEHARVHALIGPNGAGKTTVFNLLTKFLQPTSGEITLLGETITKTDPAKVARMGLVRSFQISATFPHLTVLQNVVEAPIHVLKLAREEAVQRAEKLLSRVGLSAKHDAYPKELSGGQQQRVAIARALVMQPKALLFDEPTSALDPVMAREVLSLVTDLAREGQTMIVVTHSLRLARRTANTVHVFQDGRVLESGPSEQIFNNPRQEGTRRFVDEAGGK